MEPTSDRIFYLIAVLRDDRDRGVFLNTVEKEVDRFRHREPGDRKRAADRERPPQLSITDKHKWDIDDKYQHAKRNACCSGHEHRDPGDAAVDEVAGEQETLDPHTRGEDADHNKQHVLY